MPWNYTKKKDAWSERTTDKSVKQIETLLLTEINNSAIRYFGHLAKNTNSRKVTEEKVLGKHPLWKLVNTIDKSDDTNIIKCCDEPEKTEENRKRNIVLHALMKDDGFD